MITWLLQQQANLPDEAPAGWLSPAELAQYQRLSHPKRQRDWLLGRWTARQLLQQPALMIVTAHDGAPELHPSTPSAAPTERPPLLSISHSHGWAFAASSTSTTQLGADLEWIEPRAHGFAREYFTERECQWLGQQPATLQDTLITALWSAKEAVVKATRQGLTVDTWRIECMLTLPGELPYYQGWQAWTAVCNTLEEPTVLRGWWRIYESFVLTICYAGQPQGVVACIEQQSEIPDAMHGVVLHTTPCIAITASSDGRV